MPGGRESAKAIRVMLFDDGLAFTQLSWERFCLESEARLERLEERERLADVEALGGRVIVECLRRAQDRFAAIVARRTIEGPRRPSVGAALRAFRDSLADYVLKVSCLADPEIAGSEALVASMLEPVTTWRVRRRP